ncbi:hypothetical protein ABZ135_19235 [Streptomyces sp. NPDC006339]|uniref:hypothetical protein n=1 Tax=Streptomyces sp. NPDC006339 TaxID=3156755 RepID=UPI0033A80234
MLPTGAFACVGTVLAALGHHTVLEGQLPWDVLVILALGQFFVLLPVAHVRFSLAAVSAWALVSQGVLHVAIADASGRHLTWNPRMSTVHHTGVPAGDGHTWHHASTAMTAVHVAAALVVAWLFHHSDTCVTAALAARRSLRRLAATVTTWVIRTVGAAAVPERPTARPVAPVDAVCEPTLLENAQMRRGPPGRRPAPEPVSLRPSRYHPTGHL